MNDNRCDANGDTRQCLSRWSFQKLLVAGRVLMRFNELRDALTLRLAGQRFDDAELRTVLTLLAGPGVVWEMNFGSWVLLQPERINAYAQAVIQTLCDDPHKRGCISEDASPARRIEIHLVAGTSTGG
ncbi:MAG: hypothetical protein ACKV2Q_13645 [Planctomycetaceae bacterium]